MKRRLRNDRRGTTTLELALLFPTLFGLFLGIIEIIIYVQSSVATQYGAYMAARSYQVYGVRTLDSIHYKRLRDEPYTNASQTIAEAAAEKVIFESLMWEHANIAGEGGPTSMDRFYKDGNDFSRNSNGATRNDGAVKLNVLSGSGTEITYCMPISFPGIDSLFSLAKQEWPCKNTRIGEKGYTGIAITKRAEFGVEPEVTP